MKTRSSQQHKEQKSVPWCSIFQFFFALLWLQTQSTSGSNSPGFSQFLSSHRGLISPQAYLYGAMLEFLTSLKFMSWQSDDLNCALIDVDCNLSVHPFIHLHKNNLLSISIGVVCLFSQWHPFCLCFTNLSANTNSPEVLKRLNPNSGCICLQSFHSLCLSFRSNIDLVLLMEVFLMQAFLF